MARAASKGRGARRSGTAGKPAAHPGGTKGRGNASRGKAKNGDSGRRGDAGWGAAAKTAGRLLPKAAAPSSYKVEIVTSTGRVRETVPAKSPITAERLLKALELSIDNHIVLSGNTPVPLDDKLDPKKPVTVYQTVSGG